MAAYDWCCTASVNPTRNGIDIRSILADVDDNTKKTTTTISSSSSAESSFDLTSNAQWMEYIETMEGRVDVEGGAGAYDVMRCDLAYGMSRDHHPIDPPTWRVWGQDFHLTRLVTSFRSLLECMDNSNDDHARISDEDIERALITSRSIIHALLMKAQSCRAMQSRAPPQQSEVDDVLIQLVKLTVLWTPAVPNEKKQHQNIIVRGHACSSCRPVQIHKRPTPIVATIALPLHHHHKHDKSEEVMEGGNNGDDDDDDQEEDLPSRFRSPQNKVASWCRQRRPLEDPDTYKPPGVGEVLMVKRSSAATRTTMSTTTTEILEGLTSNFFVIYKNGSLRTADEGVLRGYVRHLVIDCADRVGLTMDYSPIAMEDADKGLWESAFITSSSRLIYPISRILIPEVTDDSDGSTVDSSDSKSRITFREFWNDPNLTGSTATTDNVHRRDSSTTPRWLDLLNELLIEGGYEMMTEEKEDDKNSMKR